jgi:hypothetical protein
MKPITINAVKKMCAFNSYHHKNKLIKTENVYNIDIYYN